MLLRGDSDCCCCAHKDTALPDGETPWPWRTNGVQNMRFPRPERPFWNLLQKACYTFLEAGCWLAASCCTAAVALTAAASACVCCCLLMPAAACCCLLLPAAACCCLQLPAACCCLLLPAAACCCCWWLLLLLCDVAATAVVLLSCCCNQTASKARNNCCCCCCAHKDTALPDGETPWPWRTNGVQNMRFRRPERPFWNLLQKACYTFLDAGYWLAASCYTAAVALTATDCSYCYWCCWNPRKKSIGAAAVPTKTRPCRTGKHHGPEGRTESKICVSRGRNVPSEISYKKLAIRFSYTFLIRFSMLATGSLLAAALLPLLLLLLMLLEP